MLILKVIIVLYGYFILSFQNFNSYISYQLFIQITT